MKSCVRKQLETGYTLENLTFAKSREEAVFIEDVKI
jgi:hypothetical protein